jgi:NADPH-ferrihemoprotein reductase
LVCDPEEYDFENLDQVPEDSCVVFVMATYGEGEPTDNSVQLMQNLTESSFEFSNGEHKLEGLKYVVFSLGNRTYEHYNAIGRQVDDELTKMGAVRIGERGEGDDDKSMEEDYLEWKDNMWPAFAEAMGVEEGQGGDTPDFAVTELESHPPEKVYLGKYRFSISIHSFNPFRRRTFCTCPNEDQRHPRCQEPICLPCQGCSRTLPA